MNKKGTVTKKREVVSNLMCLPTRQAGQERFRTLSTSYYRGAHGVILVYDISNKKSFASMEKWFDEARMNANPDAVLYLVRINSFLIAPLSLVLALFPHE